MKNFFLKTLIAPFTVYLFTCQPAWANSCEKVIRTFGDLTAREISAIQEVVDATGVTLFVVGSAARGERRNPGSRLPIKKHGGKSDIDYLYASWERLVAIGDSVGPVHRFFWGPNGQIFLERLPEIGSHGIIIKMPRKDSDRILFAPGKEPVHLFPGDPNPAIEPSI